MSAAEIVREHRERYVARSRQRVAEMAEFIARLRHEAGDAPVLAKLREQLHRFAGSGGTFGYPQVTALGRQGERDCAAFLEKGLAPSSSDLERLQSFVTAIGDELAASEDDDEPTHKKRSAVLSAIGAEEKRPQILLVDDDEELHEIVAGWLQQEGMEVRSEHTCAGAIRALEENMPDGVITDINLPDGSGCEVVESVRNLPGGETAAVLIVSVLAGFLDKVEAIRCGADGYFEKPLDWEALMRRLEHLLHRGESKAPSLLYVEDDPDQAEFVRGVFAAAGYEVQICCDPQQFEDDLIGFHPDVVLMDIGLPGGVSGYDLLHYLRQDEGLATLPVIVVSTAGQMKNKIETMRAGGDDHLVKPVSAAMLLSTVAARVERARFLKGLLDRDGLTRLLTHTAFMERAKVVAGTKQREPEKELALVMIDLDHFKSVNDRYGHPVGDRVLAALAALLRRRLRQSDTIGRYGGEEFAVVIEDLRQEDAVRLVVRLLDEFGAIQFQTLGGGKFSCTFSAGIAMLDRDDTELEGWKQAADDALYEAKRTGRNRVVPGHAVALQLAPPEGSGLPAGQSYNSISR